MWEGSPKAPMGLHGRLYASAHSDLCNVTERTKANGKEKEKKNITPPTGLTSHPL